MSTVDNGCSHRLLADLHWHCLWSLKEHKHHTVVLLGVYNTLTLAENILRTHHLPSFPFALLIITFFFFFFFPLLFLGRSRAQDSFWIRSYSGDRSETPNQELKNNTATSKLSMGTLSGIIE